MPFFALQDGTDAKVHYDVREDMVPENIFFVHGNLASNRWWMPSEEIWQRSFKGAPNKGCLVYAEFLGCGESTPPKAEKDVDMHKFADDFIDLIRSLKRGPFHLVGHSTGGLIAALMLAKAPELFKKAVLLDPVGAEGITFNTAMIAAFDQMKTDRALTATVIGATIRGSDPGQNYFRDIIVEDAFKAVKLVGHWVLKALDGLDVRKEVAKIKNPVLVLHGEHDLLLPMAHSQAMAALMNNGKFQIIPDHGHCTNVESPETFVRITKEFLFS